MSQSELTFFHAIEFHNCLCYFSFRRARSSAGEHRLHTAGVVGSNPIVLIKSIGYNDLERQHADSVLFFSI